MRIFVNFFGVLRKRGRVSGVRIGGSQRARGRLPPKRPQIEHVFGRKATFLAQHARSGVRAARAAIGRSAAPPLGLSPAIPTAPRHRAATRPRALVRTRTHTCAQPSLYHIDMSFSQLRFLIMNI